MRGSILFRIYCDDWQVPPGINKFDLHPLYFRDGKPVDYRSDRKGPGGRPRPIGSRFGPQNMVCCGWALQALRVYPGIWDEARTRWLDEDGHVENSPATAAGTGRDIPETASAASSEKDVRQWLTRELGGGLRTWEAIFDELGYIPTGIGTGQHWDGFSDTGGYAHLISAAAQWILYLHGENDWSGHHYPDVLKESTESGSESGR